MRGFRFTLTAASFTGPAGTFTRPFSIDLREGDPRVEQLRAAGVAFKETPIEMPPPPPIAGPPDDQVGNTGGDAKEPIVFVNAAVTKSLAENGLTKPEDILSLGMDGLMLIDGIGEATAKKLLAQCQELVAAPPDDPDGNAGK